MTNDEELVTADEIREMGEYWYKITQESKKYWYNEITPIEAVMIRDYIDDEMLKKYGIVGHSPITDLSYDNYGLLTMEAETPDYRKLIEEQKDWGLYKGGHKDTTE